MSTIQNLISVIGGRQKNKPAYLVLVSLSKIYAFIVWVRNKLYDKGFLLKTYRADVPVISVGNLTTGGTGKTPLVIWLCNYLTRSGYKCGVLTRGYKLRKSGFSDEPAMLAKACSETTVIIEPDRVAGAQKAVKNSLCNVLVMDDGFQHRRLRRDIDIVAIDATEPFGYDRLLPAGLLREPASALFRADAVVITRYNQSSPEQIAKIRQAVRQYKPDIPVAMAVHKPARVHIIKGPEIPLEQLSGKKVYAYCGIGNPAAFFSTLKQLGVQVVGEKCFADHHHYTQADVQNLYEQAKYLDADIVLGTQKDWIKTALLCVERFDIIFAYLVVELEFVEGQDIIQNLIDSTLQKKKNG